MAYSAVSTNTTQPLGGPNQGLGTDQGDTWDVAAAKINANAVELYNRTGGTATLGNGAVQAAPPINFRNMVDGADAGINPWQRGTSFSNIGATNTYTADRFFMVAGAGSSAAMSQVQNSSVPGFNYAFQFGRGQSSGSVSTIFVGQAMESKDSWRAQGQQINFSVWLAANTGFNVTNTVGITVAQGYGTDQSVSALVNGTWTTSQNVISATQAITTTPTRYSFSGTMSNSATQLGFFLQYTPSAQTALAAENIFMYSPQLEAGGLTVFEHRDVEVEIELCQRYAFQINEGTSASIVGAGMNATTNGQTIFIPLPVQMRAAPTVTVSAGSFAFNVGGALAAVSGFAAGTTHTPNYINVVGTTTGVSGQACLLQSRQPNSGFILASSDL